MIIEHDIDRKLLMLTENIMNLIIIKNSGDILKLSTLVLIKGV